MVSEDYPIRGDPCDFENCGRTHYRIADNGFYECDNGHFQAHIRVHGEEDEDAQYGASERGAKSRTESASEASTEKLGRQIKGRAGFELYLLCYQLILRKQCNWLINSKDFPAEIEIVIKDLWTLRLPHLKGSTDETPLASDSESQSQLFSSQSEDPSTTETEEPQKGPMTRSSKAKKFPHLIDTLAFCYLASLLLRLPVLPGDIYSWAANGLLLYHASWKSIPADMRVRLSPQYKVALEPQVILQPDKLQNAITDLALHMSQKTGIVWPPLNFPMVNIRCVKELALPLDVYVGVSRLSRLLDYKFTFPHLEQSHRAKRLELPLDQLASLIVIATKLYYPFDSSTRTPRSTNEPAALAVDWSKWAAIMSQQPKGKKEKEHARKHFGFADAMALKESDIMSMSRDEMDQYLDWYGHTWASDEISGFEKDAEFRKEMLAMFPVDRKITGAAFSSSTTRSRSSAAGTSQAQGRDEVTGKLQAAMTSLKVQEAVLDEEILDERATVNRPGSYYKQWRRVEDLTEHSKVFADAVAKLIGISVERLIKDVFRTEMKLRAWNKEQEVE
ncbi:hypothetical protein NA57DRAFT_53814 [Rhizodiscina lignyota]|uniref:RRN7-type domain-containing protein n=1 Tax=Rhizodiscina lignyota TaxID=1504668 RepID=A0A9P4IM00_9PEZI|nr:hypothetical protein NA57DRAFT_53814 [Rhizodiscina lignyota]